MTRRNLKAKDVERLENTSVALAGHWEGVLAGGPCEVATICLGDTTRKYCECAVSACVPTYLCCETV